MDYRWATRTFVSVKQTKIAPMFTGIVESTGIVTSILQEGTNKTFEIESSISEELRIDQSLAHNGVCLTVVEVGEGCHRVTAIEETLDKSNLGKLIIGGHSKPGALHGC